MSQTNQIDAYQDCTDLFEKALNSARGVRASYPDFKAAKTMLFRLHHARSLHRHEARTTFPKGHPRYGKSEFDPYKCSIRPAAENDGTYWIYVEKIELNAMEIEELE